MVSSTVPVESIDNHVEEQPSHNAAKVCEQATPATEAAAAESDKAAAPKAPAVNFWKVREVTLKPAAAPAAGNAEADAEKRVETIIENIKEVTLGMCIGMYLHQ